MLDRVLYLGSGQGGGGDEAGVAFQNCTGTRAASVSQLSTACPLLFLSYRSPSPVSFDGAPSISRVSSPAINSPATKMSGFTVET